MSPGFSNDVSKETLTERERERERERDRNDHRRCRLNLRYPVQCVTNLHFYGRHSCQFFLGCPLLELQVAGITQPNKHVASKRPYQPLRATYDDYGSCLNSASYSTVLVLRMAHRKWKETKQQPSMLTGPGVPGCCLVSFHILWAILSTSTV